MKFRPNMFLFNVSDIDRAKAFYESILDLSPAFDLPTFVAYPLEVNVMFAIQRDGFQPQGEQRPNAELGVNIAATNEETDALFADWISKGATEIEPPHQEKFGYTFLVADPDGNLIRVAPTEK